MIRSTMTADAEMIKDGILKDVSYVKRNFKTTQEISNDHSQAHRGTMMEQRVSFRLPNCQGRVLVILGRQDMLPKNEVSMDNSKVPH